jgi:cytochrome c-type biogenesis protein CcmH/NrfG
VRPTETGSGSGKAPKTIGRPSLGYDRGPARRFDAPAPTKLDQGKSGGSGSGKLQPVKSGKGAALDKAPQWRDLRQSKPEAARTVSTATRIAGRVNAVAVGVGVGAVGGVHPGGYWGGGSGSDCWYNDPYGCNGWSGSYCYSSCWWGWAWPCYWACYYPYWWWCSYPYYGAYWYYPVASTIVVESEPQVVYVEQQPAEVQAAAAVGEGAVQQAPAAPGAVPLTIAAQRYLELGDRAFREGRYTDAVQFYAKAVEFAPDQGALYLVLADALFAAGDYHYGAYAIRRALELDPSLVETAVDKHSFYSDPALFDQQLAALERYLSEHSADRDARLVLALNYMFADRVTDATRVLEASPSDDPAAQLVLQQSRARAR